MNTEKPFKMREEKLESPVDAAMPGKKETHTSNRKLAAEVTASHKVPKTIYGLTVESHESTRQRVEPSLRKKNTQTTLQVKDLLR